jgi:hypothetical protein
MKNFEHQATARNQAESDAKQAGVLAYLQTSAKLICSGKPLILARPVLLAQISVTLVRYRSFRTISVIIIQWL